MKENIIYTIDGGNRHSHVGIFIQDKLTRVCDIKEISLSPNATGSIYSSVGKRQSFPGQNVLDFFINGFFLDMPVHYDQNLGTDRLVLGHYFFKGEQTLPTLIIDAGTFITLDFVCYSGFMGGIILPGVDLYLASCRKAANIPILFKEEMSMGSIPPFSLGNSTKEAIFIGWRTFLEAILKKIIATYSPEKIYLTGGDGKILQGFFPKAEFHPHFIHFSLKRIFQMKAEENNNR